MNNKNSLLTIFLFINTIIQCQPLAFPGAEGFGMYTSGGRGGKVITVDNLIDNKKDPDKGSLRWAIKQEGPRIIIFNVSGTIALEGELEIKNDDITIAGQTAPGDGICLKNYKVNIEADNVIVRYLRFRCGNEKLESSAQDAMGGKKCNNVIVDHCSMSWSIDEAASFYDNKNFTMQWCIISESLYDSGHPKGTHGYGGIWGGAGASFHHNLIASHTSRCPRFNGARFKTDTTNELVDFRNNVIFNWGYQSIYGGEGGKQNIINNYFKYGPATKEGKYQYRILNHDAYFYSKKKKDTIPAGKFYIEGNFVYGSEKATNDNWKYGVQNAEPGEKEASHATSPYEYKFIKTQTAKEAYESVLKSAGASLPNRDAIDKRIVEEVKTGNCKYGDSYGPNSGIIDSQKSVGGWPDLKSLPAPVDTDKDGMPDEWEVKNQLDKNNPADGNIFSLNKDYTNIEVYINSLVKN